MKVILQILGVLIILIGLLLLIIPDTVYDWVVANFETRPFYYGAIIGRLALGILLLMAAKISKFPRVIKVLAYLMLLAAVAFLLMGFKNFQEVIFFILLSLMPYIAFSGLACIIFGTLFIYAFSATEPRVKKETL